MFRYAAVIGLALLIDGAQIALGAGFMGLGTAFSFATAGIGTPVFMPLATVLGFVTDVTISATFGAGLILVLAYNDMFYLNYGIGGAVLELMPGIDVIPGWTFIAVRCVLKKMEEEGALGSVAGRAVGVAGGSAKGKGASSAVRGGNTRPFTRQTAPAQQTTGQKQAESARTASVELKNVEGVRPPKTSVQYAA